LFRKILKGIFSKFGYQIKRHSSESSKVSIERYRVLENNFKNIAREYEKSFLKERTHIPLNEVRFDLLSRGEGTPPTEAYFLIDSIHKSMEVPGDVCEFGVAQGETSALIANEISTFTNKKLHLFDSFEGLPAPTDKDQLKDDIFDLGDIKAYEGHMSNPEELVLDRLKSISFPASRFIIHKGFIEEIINSGHNFPDNVSFAYVDFDFYEPIKIALEFLHKKTSIGSIIIIDDYDWFSTGAKSAVDEFLEINNSKDDIYDLFIPDKRLGYFAILERKG